MIKYGSRKFILAAVVIVTATGLLALKLIDASQWVTSVSGALAFYSAANVAQRAVTK